MKKLKTIVLTLALAAFGAGDAYLIAHEVTKDSSSEKISIRSRRKCTNCKGKGYVQERVACSNCGGNGCGVCDWRGYTTETVRCSVCDGTGWIEVYRN